MERLTASPYVADIFLTCGATQVVEYSEGGNIHDLIKLARLSGKDTMSSVEKLRICVQVAAAVADLHSFETDNVPSLSHNDLCCHQFLLVDGIYKLNDFHLAVFMKQNKYTNQMCPAWTSGFTSFVSSFVKVMQMAFCFIVLILHLCSFTRRDHRKSMAMVGWTSWICHRLTRS
jgi:serine/threonine protein kinase